MDQTDRDILVELTTNSNQSVKEIAGKVNLSVSPVHERIKKLENNGVIQGYSAVVNPEVIGFGVLVYIQVKFIRHHDNLFDAFTENIQQLHEVQEAVFTAGEYDVMLKVYLKDMDDYHNFILHRLSKLDNISNVKTSFAMRSINNNKVTLNPETIKFFNQE
ncbi:MAG: Lrp/AsnC family transcriptional regulator [Cruoricaptor ignavus]|nr:Lrp/AsnC family transcriptional regulator [Cruoricaptor ignavus]